MPKDKEEKDCPFKLVKLVNRAKPWREEASKVFIEYYYDLRTLKRENKAIFIILSAILACVFKLAFIP